jgi:hypothetical protein
MRLGYALLGAMENLWASKGCSGGKCEKTT